MLSVVLFSPDPMLGQKCINYSIERSRLAPLRLARLDLLAFFRAKQIRRRKRLLLVYFMKKNHANEENESYQISYQ